MSHIQHDDDGIGIGSTTSTPLKQSKRQEQRACDLCRRKKIRCNGPSQPSRTCTLCTKAGIDCTYLQRSSTRHAPRKAYMHALEARLQKTEALLHRLFPNMNLDDELEKVDVSGPRQSSRLPLSSKSRTLTSHRSAIAKHNVEVPPLPAEIIKYVRLPQVSEDDLPGSDDEIFNVPLTDPVMEELLQKTYMGKSSEITLITDTFDFKFGEGFRIHMRDHSASWRRPEFWTLPHYEVKDEYALVETPFHAELPPRDLFVKLLDAYFDHVNIFLPLLHKGLFLQQLSAGMHRRDPQFLAVLLLVFALASRCIQDPRVLTDPSQPRSAGWKYFDMAEPMTRATFFMNGRIFDLQTKVLATIFLWGSTVPGAAWMYLGLAITMALEVGAHRKKLYKEDPNLIDEQWKRAFWIILSFDRVLSSNLGRPCTIQDESFDVDLPLEVDDDCWDLSDAGHHYPLKHMQPSDRPSYVTYFVIIVKLRQILAFAMRTIYSINHAKSLPQHVRQQWELLMLAEMDASLTRWGQSVPHHLRWDTKHPDGIWSRQSISLWCGYNYMKIFLHAQFIQLPILSQPRPTGGSSSRTSGSPSRPGRSSSTTTTPASRRDIAKRTLAVAPPDETYRRPSALAICVEASRKLIDCFEAFVQRTPPPHGINMPIHAGAVFICSLVLLLAAWTADATLAEDCDAGGSDSDDEDTMELSDDSESHNDRKQRGRRIMQDVSRCLDALKYAEQFWIPAGKCWDVLDELVHSGRAKPDASRFEDASFADAASTPASTKIRLLRSMFPHYTYELKDASPIVDADVSNRPASAPALARSSDRMTALWHSSPSGGQSATGTGSNPSTSEDLDIGWLASSSSTGDAAAEHPPDFRVDAHLGAASSVFAPFGATAGNPGASDPFEWLGINPYGQFVAANTAQWSQGPTQPGDKPIDDEWIMLPFEK